jgi:hypothetical protein
MNGNKKTLRKKYFILVMPDSWLTCLSATSEPPVAGQSGSD